MNHPGPLSWHDYRPDQGRIPNNVTHLRIGFSQYQQLLKGDATTQLLIEVPREAFQYHPNLKQVQIYLPAVSVIGFAAFLRCVGLEQVEFVMKPPREEMEDEEEGHDPPSQLVTIGRSSFNACRNLKSVIGLGHAAESLKFIQMCAFENCGSLINVDFLPCLEMLESLGEAAFYKGATLTTVDLSKAVNLKMLQERTFQHCAALVTINLPPNLEIIEYSMFDGCSSLKHIHLPQRLQIIGNHAFAECSEMTRIVLPSSLRRIGEYCFFRCGNLSQVVLPSSKFPFLKRAPFDGSCESLSSLELPNPVPRRQWPIILEQEDGIASVNGGIGNPKNRNTIVWNFLRQNMTQFFMEDNAVTISRRRPAPPSLYKMKRKVPQLLG